MNLNPKNWYYPQWITNTALLIFFMTLPKVSYALFGSIKYGGITPFTVIACILLIYAHLHNFGLLPELTLSQLMLKFLPSMVIIVVELFLVLVMAIVFKRVIYWADIARLILVILTYIASVIFCYMKIETRSVAFGEIFNGQGDVNNENS